MRTELAGRLLSVPVYKVSIRCKTRVVFLAIASPCVNRLIKVFCKGDIPMSHVYNKFCIYQ
jgi:hypothetical protein